MIWLDIFRSCGTFVLAIVVWLIQRDMRQRLNALEDRNTPRDQALQKWAAAYVKAAPRKKYWKLREAQLFEAVSGVKVHRD